MEIVTLVGNDLKNELEMRNGKGGEEEAMAGEANVGQPWGKCEEWGREGDGLFYRDQQPRSEGMCEA